MGHYKKIAWLLERLKDPDVVVVDCRFVLGSPQAGMGSFREGHIPGAVYFDLEQDLSAPKAIHGGRHPLPDVAELSAKLSKAGIAAGKTVVAYDDQGGAMASRLWWLLRYMGHSSVYVLDGSFAMWKAAGYPVTSEIRDRSPEVFIPKVQDDMVVGMQEVRGRLGKQAWGKAAPVLMDSREEPRYRGAVEPIDAVAGHIPGAVNYFWKESLNPEGQWSSDGMWKSGEEQKGRFEKLDASKEIIVYCGSGVTACPNIIALQEAGFTNVKLYAGSWSDWISYNDNPIATGV